MNLVLQESGAMVSDSVQKAPTYELGKYIDTDPETIFVYTKYCIHMKRKPHLYIQVRTNDGRLLPTVDIDCTPGGVDRQNKLDLIMTWFDRWPFALIQSSRDAFWLVFDKPCEIMDHALDYITIPDIDAFCDRKYKDCARRQNQFVLRATPKNGFIPRVIKSNMITPEAREWLEEFVAYWSSGDVKEYVAIQAMNAL